MARSPRASVSKTSGQGVSRLSYQKGYSMGNRGATSGAFKVSAQDAPAARDYRKSAKVAYPSGINVSYGDTLDPTDLEDLKALGDKSRS